MKVDYENKEIIYTCGCCGYKYKEKSAGHPTQYITDPGFGREPFKNSTVPFIYKSDYYRPDTSLNMYACPKCGVVQIESEIHCD